MGHRAKLKGPAKWTYFYLYVILDVFSRYAVGWTVQHREDSLVAKDLIAQVCEQQHIASTLERFVRRPPRPPSLPTAAWINKPDDQRAAEN